MPGTLLCTLFTFINLIHITVPLAGCYHYYPPLTGWRNRSSGPRSHTLKWQIWDTASHSLSVRVLKLHANSSKPGNANEKNVCRGTGKLEISCHISKSKLHHSFSHLNRTVDMRLNNAQIYLFFLKRNWKFLCLIIREKKYMVSRYCAGQNTLAACQWRSGSAYRYDKYSLSHLSNGRVTYNMVKAEIVYTETQRRDMLSLAVFIIRRCLSWVLNY